MADVVRAHRAELAARQTLSLAERRVLRDIELCRTAALGGHLDVCRSCGFERPAYDSCRNRHCPKCQALAQEKWIAGRIERLLPVGHFHVVFTVPAELRPLALALPRAVYDALFAAASETLLDLSATRLGGAPGVTMVLHTWTRELAFHPHVHAIVSAGALAHDGATWCPARGRFLFPLPALREVFRAKMMDALRQLHARGVLDRLGLADPLAFGRFMAALPKKWVVYPKAPFAKSTHVVGIEAPAPRRDIPTRSWRDRRDLLLQLTGRDVDVCPRCSARLEHVPVARAPPSPIEAVA